MSYYKLKDEAYLVSGTARHAIYDFETNQLYSISEKTKTLIESLGLQENLENSLSEIQAAIFKDLKDSALIEKTQESIKLKNIRELKKEFPLNFSWIEVTRQCNLSCSFCYEGSNPYCTERMSINEFKVVMRNLLDIGIKRIQFIGGEPMILKKDLRKMIDLARPNFEFIEVYSNGVLIDESWCQYFKEKKIHIALSIHSYIPEEHDKLTQVKGSHRNVLKALKLIQQYKIPYRIGSVRSKDCNVGKKHKDSIYTLHPKLPKITGRADLKSLDIEMFKEKAITKMTKRFPISKSQVTRQISGHQCFSKDLYISSLLDVYPCVMERRVSYGNLKNAPLKELIDDKIRHLSKDYIEGCRGCEYRYGCFDCRPDSNGNDFLKKPWHCSYDPRKGEWADLEIMYKRLNSFNEKLNSIPVVVDA